MGPGTLYGSLDRTIEAGLVAKGNTQDPRRRPLEMIRGKSGSDHDVGTLAAG
jgi:hypothetical protein